MESATGNIVSGLQAPTAENIEAFLAANPGWEVLPEEDSESSEDEDKEEEEEKKEGEGEGEGKDDEGKREIFSREEKHINIYLFFCFFAIWKELKGRITNIGIH